MPEKNFDKLWEEYAKTKSKQIRDQLITEYAPLIKVVAGRLKMYLGNNVELDDLIGYGAFGLMDAIDKFELNKKVKFETYASLRIRGSILDSIRKNDWVPRSLRQKHKDLEAAYQKLEEKLGRAATDEEMAKELNITVAEFDTLVKDTNILTLTSLEDFVDQNYEKNMNGFAKASTETPEDVATQNAIKEVLVDTIKNLPEKEQKVVYLYYYEQLTLKEISKILEVSESRISQLHSKAMMRLKGKLGKHKDVLLGV
ncbi:MAG: FliA/WhiG family RNA polymerase sigma factor [Clostridia bacterium]|jgi:RNA polymerase sigma factor for flagellar operon FliA|nr:FliA/WhiG family RNA polymerase sigma factor [Clostridia bacterium]